MPADGLEYTSYVPVKRFLLEISYNGSGFSGWQIQPNAPSVQQTMQELMTGLYNNQKIHLIGSSRTDAGVHALGFAASFLVPERPAIPANYLMRALNRMLPPEIAVRSIKEVPLPFHSRYDALGKAYTYVINRGGKSAFTAGKAWHPPFRMDVAKMKEAAAYLTGEHDFSSFVVERSEIDNAVRTIYRIEFDEFGDFLCITFVGNGFLYKMIRCLVGMLAGVASGKYTPADAGRILESCDRTQAPATAIPDGLYLMKVFYDEAELNDFKLAGIPFAL